MIKKLNGEKRIKNKIVIKYIMNFDINDNDPTTSLNLAINESPKYIFLSRINVST